MKINIRYAKEADLKKIVDIHNIKTKDLGYQTLFAIIFDTNIGSVKLLEKYNFEKWGFLPDAAEIDGNKISHIYYGKKL